MYVRKIMPFVFVLARMFSFLFIHFGSLVTDAERVKVVLGIDNMYPGPYST